MGWRLLLNGITIGLAIAAPVGPIGVLCVRRTIDEGRVSGLVSGLGAATADMIYGGIAGLGLTFVSDVLVGQQVWLRLIGGGFLCFLGIRTLSSRPVPRPASAQGKGLLGMYASTLFLTLTNPVTILSFAAVFAGLGLAETDHGGAAALVMGVFLGSALWWLALSSVVGLVRHRLGPSVLRWLNRASGIVIAGFGVAALLSAAA